MSSIESILLRIQQDPYRYLGQKTLSALDAYLKGYGYASSEQQMMQDRLPDWDRSFGEWVCRKLCLPRTAHSWASLLLLVSEDDFRAFDMFFALWPEYVASTPAANPSGFGGWAATSGMVQLVQGLQESPSLLGFPPSVLRLAFFLFGYESLHEAYGIRLEGAIDLRLFSVWVANKYHSSTIYPWHRIVVHFHPQEADALTQGFQLLSTFISEFPKRASVPSILI